MAKRSTIGTNPLDSVIPDPVNSANEETDESETDTTESRSIPSQKTEERKEELLSLSEVAKTATALAQRATSPPPQTGHQEITTPDPASEVLSAIPGSQGHPGIGGGTMAVTANKVGSLPGTDVVGRGIYLKPHQPYVLKDYLVKRDDGDFKKDDENVFYFSEGNKSFSVPPGYAVNDSPPMPTDRVLNQTVIEESWERLDMQMGFDANVAAGIGPFSIDSQASQSKHLRSEEAAFYALRTSFIPFWAVYLPNILSRLKPDIKLDDIPDRFQHEDRRLYEEFFSRFGTHYVSRAWVGGKATLTFIVAKSSGLTKEKIQAGIKASFTGIASADSKMDLNEEAEKLKESSECQVSGKGGDEIKLASLSSLNEGAYKEWVETIKGIPQVIELDVMGIWNLVPDAKKAQALQDAYRAETVFRPISAVFGLDEKIFIMRGNMFFFLDLKKRQFSKPRFITDYFRVLNQKSFKITEGSLRKLSDADSSTDWNKLKGIQDQEIIGEEEFLEECTAVIGKQSTEQTKSSILKATALRQNNFDRIDSALVTDDKHIFLFRENQCTCLDYEHSRLVEGYPKKITEVWPEVTFDRIDASINCGADTAYFFSGDQYVRCNMNSYEVDAGYPKKIKEGWTGVTFNRIDAALYWGSGVVYFFRNDEYTRFDMTLYRADPGYPKSLIGDYVEDWQFLEPPPETPGELLDYSNGKIEGS